MKKKKKSSNQTRNTKQENTCIFFLPLTHFTLIAYKIEYALTLTSHAFLGFLIIDYINFFTKCYSTTGEMEERL